VPKSSSDSKKKVLTKLTQGSSSKESTRQLRPIKEVVSAPKKNVTDSSFNVDKKSRKLKKHPWRRSPVQESSSVQAQGESGGAMEIDQTAIPVSPSETVALLDNTVPIQGQDQTRIPSLADDIF
jgi:hypothetical protein